MFIHTCSVHKFISEISETGLDPAAKCVPIKPNLEANSKVILRDPKTNPGGSYIEGDTNKKGILRDSRDNPILGANQVHNTFFNRAAWIQAQDNNDSCKAAKTHLMSGKTPTTRAGDLSNEIRFLIRNANLASDGLLVTKGD